MSKIHVFLQPCPWCETTPDLRMPISDFSNSGKTWLWTIECINSCCPMKPESPHVAIRKTTKGNAERLAMKLGMLADKWNAGNDYPCYEKKIVDVSELEKKY